jgi:lysophospholipase L1-like esterase
LDPRLRFLDMRDPRIQAAMAITPHVMLDMRSVAEKEAMRLIVALIPTKERVYGRLLKRAGYREKYLRLAEALDQENAARAWLAGFLRKHHIENVDLLPALEAEVDERDLFSPTDPHPNKDGYRVIAETINRYLNSSH